jgi:hypothetical protein
MMIVRTLLRVDYRTPVMAVLLPNDRSHRGRRATQSIRFCGRPATRPPAGTARRRARRADAGARVSRKTRPVTCPGDAVFGCYAGLGSGGPLTSMPMTSGTAYPETACDPSHMIHSAPSRRLRERRASQTRALGRLPLVRRDSAARFVLHRCFCLKATAMVLDLHPIGSSSAPSLCLCTGRNASGQVALPWVVAKRAPRRHRLRRPALMRERGAECRKRIPIRTDRLR